MERKNMSTSARLQHAQNQYESLLIRAGEIIEHVPNSNEHSMSNSNAFSGAALDSSFDSTEESMMMSGAGYEVNTTHTHAHWSNPVAGGAASGSHSVRFNLPGRASSSSPLEAALHSSPTSTSSSGNNAHSVSAAASGGHFTSVMPPALTRNESDGFALSVEDDEKLNIIITLQAEVTRLKVKLETALNSAEETINELYQAHSTAELAHANTVSSLNKSNSRLQHENELLRQQLATTQRDLAAERTNMLEATHLIRRLHSRHKIITHGLLPSSKRPSTTGGKNKSSMRSPAAERARSSSGNSSKRLTPQK